MTRVATMGTSSCATIAIAHFKGDNYDDNEKYLADKSSFVEPKNSVEGFYQDVLYPTSQPLGHSDEYPFDALMDAIDESDMRDKFIIATLGKSQTILKDGYWPKRLEARGFSLLEKTKNDIGEVCFIYTRNRNKVE